MMFLKTLRIKMLKRQLVRVKAAYREISDICQELERVPASFMQKRINTAMIFAEIKEKLKQLGVNDVT